jgi:hypothetical protein
MIAVRHLTFLLISFAFGATPASALIGEIINYIEQYNLGIDYSNSIDYVTLSYQTDTAGNVPTSCELVAADPSKKRCQVGMVGSASSGWGIFLQRAFKKQGFWYFDYDLGFGARYLSGSLPARDESLYGLPLRNAKFSLGAVVAKPYIEFGVTPDRWPDVLISMGPAIQVAAGSVTINDKLEKVAVGTSSYTGPYSLLHGFIQLELVLKRFAGDGAFSLIAESDSSGQGEGTNMYPKSIDTMSDFRGKFSHNVSGMAYGFGLKLVTPWP